MSGRVWRNGTSAETTASPARGVTPAGARGSGFVSMCSDLGYFQCKPLPDGRFQLTLELNACDRNTTISLQAQAWRFLCPDD